MYSEEFQVFHYYDNLLFIVQRNVYVKHLMRHMFAGVAELQILNYSWKIRTLSDGDNQLFS
jgi:hypothetical protein